MTSINNLESTQKINYILNEIKSVKNYSDHFKKAKQFKTDFYLENIDKLKNLSLDKIKKHSFTSEVLSYGEMLEKQVFIPKFYKKVVKLEKHTYAPEMNKLHFKNSFISVPGKTNIEDALSVVINNNSLQSLKKLINQL